MSRAEAKTAGAPPRTTPWIALAVFTGFAILYALTWNGRYLHDGPLFLKSLAEGEWWHVHPAYLPCAHALRLLVGWLPGIDGAGSLALLAILSGAAMTAFSFSLGRGLGLDLPAALTVAALVGLSPVVWSAAGMVEIHVFGGAGACAASWIAIAAPTRAVYKASIATAVALSAHMTNVILLPLLVTLSTERERERERESKSRAVHELALALAGAGAVAAAMRSIGEVLPPQASLAGAFPALIDQVASWLHAPVAFAARLREEFVRPWLFLCLGPLLVLLPGRRAAWWARAVAAATGIAGALLVAAYIPLGGQYGLVLCPLLVVGAAQALSALAPGRPRAMALTALVAATILLAIPERERLARDPDRDWAEAVTPFLDGSDVILCLGPGRTLWVGELSAARAIDFMPAGDQGGGEIEARVLSAVEQQRANGRSILLDPLILSEGPRYASLRPVIAAIESTLELVPLDDAPLLAARLP